jgi:hypothetical protein
MSCYPAWLISKRALHARVPRPHPQKQFVFMCGIMQRVEEKQRELSKKWTPHGGEASTDDAFFWGAT